MSQITHQTNGDGLPEFPAELPVAPVNVYMHDSGMLATHDYSCPVCREEHAIIDLSCGVMKPCWNCQADGWVLKKIEPKTGIIASIISIFK